MNTQDQSDPDTHAAGSTAAPTIEIHRQAAEKAPRQPSSRHRKDAERKPRTRRANRVRRARTRKPTLQKLKARIQARLGCLTDTALKRVLIACGVAGGLAIAIIALAKFVPVGVAILAILGLGVVVRFMQELRHLPFCPSPQ